MLIPKQFQTHRFQNSIAYVRNLSHQETARMGDEAWKDAASIRLSSGWQASAVNHPHTSCHGSSRRDAAMLQAPTPGHLCPDPIPGAARETNRGWLWGQPAPAVLLHD